MTERPQIFIFTALDCEARPLIEFYRLKKNMDSLFPMYCADNRILTVTGMGKVSMAAGVAYALAFISNTRQPIMLNIGIAGHYDWPLGTLAIADKIVDSDSGKRFYPLLPARCDIRSGEIQTQSQPHTDYAVSKLYDMEASAFYEIALKFSTVELCHCIKIISDNIHHSISAINPNQTKTWIAEQLPAINDYIDKLSGLQATLKTPELPGYPSILNTWHFTIAQQIKLLHLLQRWYALTGYDWEPSSQLELQNAQQVIKQISQDINNLNVSL